MHLGDSKIKDIVRYPYIENDVNTVEPGYKDPVDKNTWPIRIDL